ncbi:unnamed protein product [Ceutorhynchus assimilis]|uniref:Sorbitol dehydrogenase n=1 Tax=Ceutorhynchus assimilis TaxID=467358 RepID=A0A9N9QMT0_9CUCU|nr:unnamed protein product [Ceutorhynchus assimilis]
MALKIAQCIAPILQYGRHQLLQVFYPSTENTQKKPISFLAKINEFKNKLVLNRTISERKCCKEPEENLAAVLHGEGDLRLENRPIPKYNANQVLVEVEVCGICDSDVSLFGEGRLGTDFLKKPTIIGHEASGTVWKCGECVKNLKPGDKVAIEPLVPCRMCLLCKLGKYNVCPNLCRRFAPYSDGNLSRYYVHESDFCYKVPKNMDLELAALMEPLSRGVHACKKAKITSGDSVLVLGSGPFGLLTMQAARAYGASSVVVLDIDPFKLSKAMEMGADCTIDCKKLPEQEVVRQIHDLLGNLPNKTFACSCYEKAIRVGILATATCGKIVIAAFGANDQCLPIMDSFHKEMEIICSIGYANDYQTAIDMVTRGKVDPRPVVTHHFKMCDAIKAYELAANENQRQLKIFIHPNPKWQPESC